MSSGVDIMGMGVVTPYGEGIDKFWEGLVNGKVAIFPQQYSLKKNYSFYVSRCEGLNNDIFQLASQAAAQALLNYQQTEKNDDPKKIELVLATALGRLDESECYIIQNRFKKENLCSPAILKQYSFKKLYDQLQKQYSLSGQGVIVSTACTSGQSALYYAYDQIQKDSSKRILVVGVEKISQFILHGLNCMQALTKKGVKPFDINRDGLAIGEGAGAILLGKEQCNHRMSNGKTVIKKIGCFNEAFRMANPRKDAQGMLRALVEVSCVEDCVVLAAANGTLHNDSAILTVLKNYFSTNKSQIPVTTIKGHIGHSLGASGIIETIAGVLMLKHKKIPAIQGLTEPELDGFRLITKNESINSENLVSIAAGFGGSCAALMLKHYERGC
ncbi:MAG: hypothetical protein GY710_23250 [Desulfobacteraceae bacterium]|nr:hypothetical protein [Desulfobacteraceae bacterium]